MFVKLAVFACSLALAATYSGPLAGGQPAALYPAGVDPKACPNYPDCSNPSVAVNQEPIHQQYSAPQYNQPQQYQAQPQYHQPQAQYQPQYQQPQTQYQPQYNQYNPQQYTQTPTQTGQYSPDVQEKLNRGEYIGDGDYHGEGLAEALAPGYEGHAQSYQQAPSYNAGPSQNLGASYNSAQSYNSPTQYNPSGQYNPYNAAPYNAIPSHQYNNAPAVHAQPAQIPAGVDPSSCPNYPFCT